MFSSFVRVLLAVIGLSPILAIIYIIEIVKSWHKLTLYIAFDSWGIFTNGLKDFLNTNGVLIVFITMVIFARLIVFLGRKFLEVRTISMTSFKPSETNFVSIMFSSIIGMVKFYDSSISDGYILLLFALLGIFYGILMKSSYHHNIILKFFGYRHYEVALSGGGTYLLLTKEKIIDKTKANWCIFLTDYMLMNVTDKKTK